MATTKARLNSEPLRFGDAMTSEGWAKVGVSHTDDRKVVSLLFDDFQARASAQTGRVVSKTVTLELPIIGGPGNARIALDVEGGGNIFQNRGGRYAASLLTNPKVQSIFRKKSVDFRPRWEFSVSRAGLLVTSIAISAAAAMEDTETLVTVDSASVVMR